MADDPSVPAGTVDARLALKQSEEAINEALEAFDLLKRRIRNRRQKVTSKEVQDLFSQLSKARTKLTEEVEKHEKRALRKAGLLADAPLDLDALRASIGGKLDRIRAAGTAKGIPGEPDG